MMAMQWHVATQQNNALVVNQFQNFIYIHRYFLMRNQESYKHFGIVKLEVICTFMHYYVFRRNWWLWTGQSGTKIQFPLICQSDDWIKTWNVISAKQVFKCIDTNNN